MNRRKLSAVLMVFLALTMTACGQITTKVKVVDEEGNPIEEAEVKIRYIGYKDENSKILKTDKDGLIEDVGKPELRLHVYVNKEGYYQTLTGGLDRTKDHDLTIILRKKIDPIPLFSKKMSVGFPRRSEWLGFDLEFGDFVDPFGQGKQADFLLKVNSLQTTQGGDPAPNKESGKLWIKFQNQHEGFLYEKENYLQNGEMKMPHQAPLEGYENPFFREEKAYRNSSRQHGLGIFLRTRVKVDKKGNLVSAHYTKINSDLTFDPRETGWHSGDKGKPKSFGFMNFTYYFNPTPNDRNLEFDPTRNLFKDLPRKERVTQP